MMVTEEILQSGLPEIEEQPDLDSVPSRFEAMCQFQGMKDSAPGDEEITVGCLRASGDTGKELMVRTIQRLWTTDPHEWEAALHQATGFRS